MIRLLLLMWLGIGAGAAVAIGLGWGPWAEVGAVLGGQAVGAGVAVWVTR